MPTHRTRELRCKLCDGRYGSRYCRKRKVFGLIISADMKVSDLCGIAASKSNHILWLIRRNITHREKSYFYLCIKQ